MLKIGDPMTSKLIKFPLMIFVLLLLCSCAAHGHIHKRPVPGKKACNCPDFGMTVPSGNITAKSYPHSGA